MAGGERRHVVGIAAADDAADRNAALAEEAEHGPVAHREDKLGKLALTDEGLRLRDRTVLGFFRARGIPVCGVIGGGYSNDVPALAARHAILFEEAARLA